MKESELYNVLENDSINFKNVEMCTSEELRNEKNQSETQTKIEKIKFYLKIIFPYIFGTSSLILYCITLRGCTKTQFECLQIITNDLIKKMLLVLFLSALFLNLQFLVFLNNKDTKTALIIILSTFFCLFIYDTGADFDSHGAYNRLLLLFFILIWGVIYLLGKVIFYFMRRFPIITTFSLIIIGFLLNQIKVNIVENSCEGWDKGLRGVAIDNKGETLCKIRPPKVCYFKIFDGYLDVTRLLGENCETMVSSNKLSNNIDHMLDKNARYVGYPRTEKYKYFPESQQNIYQKNVMKDLVNMEDPKISQDAPSLVLGDPPA